MALSRVAPIQNQHTPIRTLEKIDPAEKRVRRLENVRAMPPRKTRAGPFQGLHIHPAAMEIQGKKLPPVIRRPLVPLVNQGAAMRVPASQRVTTAPCVARRCPTLARVKMPVVRDHLQRLKHHRVRAHRVRPSAMPAGDHLPQVTVHGVDKKAITPGIPIVPPGIGGPVAQRFKHLPPRMKAPNPSGQRDRFRLGLAG